MSNTKLTNGIMRNVVSKEKISLIKNIIDNLDDTERAIVTEYLLAIAELDYNEEIIIPNCINKKLLKVEFKSIN